MDEYDLYREQIEEMSDEELEKELKNAYSQLEWVENGWAFEQNAARPDYVPTKRDEKEAMEKLKIVREEMKKRNPEKIV